MEENQSHGDPTDFPLRGLYEGWIAEDLDYIQFINSENKVFQEIREAHHREPDIVVFCMEFLFENTKQIKFLKGRIEDVRERIKKLS